MAKLFHGTTKRYYHTMIERYGVYKHESGKPVYLSPHPQWAIDHAAIRADEFRDWPVVLIIDQEKVPDIRTRDGDNFPSCTWLDLSWYEVAEAIGDKNLEARV